MKDNATARAGSQRLMKYGMWACCAIMLLPIIAYLVVGGAVGASQSFVAFALLLLCVGVHLVMHRLMGKPCHGKARDADDRHDAPDARAAGIAVE